MAGNADGQFGDVAGAVTKLGSAPFAFDPIPTSMALFPMSWLPNCARAGALDVSARDPVILVTLPRIVARRPYILRARGYGNGLHRSGGRGLHHHHFAGSRGR